MLREGIRLLLESQPDLQIADDEPDALLLVDLSDDGAMEQLRSAAVSTRVIALCESAEVEPLDLILRAGARAVVVKTAHPTSLLEAIRSVRKGRKWLDPEIQSCLMSRDSVLPNPERRWRTLTKREREIASLVLAGHRYKEIACELQISEHTVRNHLRNVFTKLQIKSRVELAPYAHQAVDA